MMMMATMEECKIHLWKADKGIKRAEMVGKQRPPEKGGLNQKTMEAN